MSNVILGKLTWMAESAEERLKIFIPETHDEAILKAILNYIRTNKSIKDPEDAFQDSYLRYVRSSKGAVVSVKDYANSIEDILNEMIKIKKSDDEIKALMSKTRKRMSE